MQRAVVEKPISKWKFLVVIYPFALGSFCLLLVKTV